MLVATAGGIALTRRRRARHPDWATYETALRRHYLLIAHEVRPTYATPTGEELNSVARLGSPTWIRSGARAEGEETGSLHEIEGACLGLAISLVGPFVVVDVERCPHGAERRGWRAWRDRRAFDTWWSEFPKEFCRVPPPTRAEWEANS